MASPTAVGPEPEARPDRRAFLACWIAAALLSAVTSYQAIERYHALRTGWSWDLAYYNQWFYALTQGDGVLSVRPIASYAVEGPSVWKANYLAPVRLLIAPVYALAPSPITLLVIHAVVFWWVVPAAFRLAWEESRSSRFALVAASAVPLTPLLWPLAWNDFRELQMAIPFVLWTFAGWRSRKRGFFAFGAFGMLACRQELALVLLTLPILPAREREDIGRTYVWSWCSAMLGLVWILFAFFGYLYLMVGRSAPEGYIGEFGGPKAPLLETIPTAADFLFIGLGAWAVVMLASPRAALLVFPWVWSLASGRWALRLIGTVQWHHVRYTAPMVAVGLAAGILGLARIDAWSRRRPAMRTALGVLFLASMLVSNVAIERRFSRIPEKFPPQDVAAFRRLLHKVGPGDGVLAHYDLTAPLSNRRHLYSDVLDINKPAGYPNLDRRFRWVFDRRERPTSQVWKTKGFRVVYEGPSLIVYRRDDPGPAR